MAITYCIVCNVTGEKYYGSTKRTLEQRLSKHKGKDNTCCSKKIILRGDYDIYQLAEYDTIEKAEMKEKWYINNKECINEQRVRLTDEERKEYYKEYYQENKDKILERMKEKYEINCEKINKIHKEYYYKNKDKICEKAKETIECEFCKFIGYKRHLKNHQKSKRCLKYQ